MKLIHPTTRAQVPALLEQMRQGTPVLFSRPNARHLADFEPVDPVHEADEQVVLELDEHHPRLNITWDESDGRMRAWVKGELQDREYTVRPDQKERVHILMNTSIIDDPWCAPALKPYLHPGDVVCVLALSFFDDTRTEDDWNRQYKKGVGCWYKANTDVFAPFGIPESDVHWIHYFQDTRQEMLETIAGSNVLLLTGGAPDLMMQRIREKKLQKALKQYEGVILGYSAGAMVQLQDYHIIPDADYPEFSWQKGLGYLNDFDIEVHYHAAPHQTRWLHQVQQDFNRRIYCLYEEGGMIVSQAGIECFGQVDVLDPLPDLPENTRRLEGRTPVDSAGKKNQRSRKKKRHSS